MKQALKQLRNRWNSLLGLDTKRDKLDAEVEHHLELLAKEFESEGMSSKEAMRAARKRFGGVDHLKEDCQENWGVLWLENLGRNIRRSCRRLLKDRGFTTTALLTLALCLGANLTIFAVVDSVLLRPLPFPNANQLVVIYNTYPVGGWFREQSSIANYYERRDGAIDSLSSVSLYREGTAIIGSTGATQLEDTVRVTHEFFDTLGVKLQKGRSFRDEELTYQTDWVTIISDSYWKENYDSDSNILGKKIFVDGEPREIVGILPPDYRFLSSKARLYLPLSADLERRASTARHWTGGGGGAEMIARTKAGVSIDVVQAQIDSHNDAMEANNPDAEVYREEGFRSLVVSLHAEHVHTIKPMLLLIQIGAFCLLLIGAANLVNLLLIRASGRSKELAIGRALGAGQRHIVGEILAETVILTLAGGLLGFFVASASIQLIMTLGASELPLGASIAIDGRIARTTLAGSILFGLVMAIPTTWFSIRNGATGSLSVESRSATTSRAAQRVRHSFIAAQVAVAFVLLSGSGLLGVSLYRTMLVDPGFDATKAISGEMSLPYSGYPDGQKRAAFVEQLLENLKNKPGVSSAGIATNIPFSGNSDVSSVYVKGRILEPGEPALAHYTFGVSGDYFQAMGITLREGRLISSDDSQREERTCVIDQAFAEHYWQDRSPIGHQIFLGPHERDPEEAFTIVGVVNNAKQTELTESGDRGTFYVPYRYIAISHFYVVERSVRNSEILSRIMQETVREIDPNLPVSQIKQMDARIADSLVARRAPFLLLTVFAIVALGLASIGTYGALAYAVNQRRREIGIRLAIGARPKWIRKQFLTLGIKLFTIGGFLGIAGALVAGRAMKSILFEVPLVHTPTLLGTIAIMGTVTLLACLIPAYRAARVSPAETLGEG